jgi:hypothetical protein
MTIKKLEIALEAPIFNRMFVNTSPVQDPNLDPVLKEYMIGGPNVDSDVRFIIDVQTLEYLLSVARKSQTQRVVVNRAGVRIKVCRSVKSCHVYETIHIDGSRPYPEQAPNSLKMPLTAFKGSDLLRNRK